MAQIAGLVTLAQATEVRKDASANDGAMNYLTAVREASRPKRNTSAASRGVWTSIESIESRMRVNLGSAGCNLRPQPISYSVSKCTSVMVELESSGRLSRRAGTVVG